MSKGIHLFAVAYFLSHNDILLIIVLKFVNFWCCQHCRRKESKVMKSVMKLVMRSSIINYSDEVKYSAVLVNCLL
jgi:hypothetical protein